MGWLIYFVIPPVLIAAMRLLSLVLPAKPAQLLSYYTFAITSFLLMGCCALYGTLVAIPLRIVGYGGLIQWTVARAFKWCMWLFTGVTFRVTGSMKKEGGFSGEDALRDRPAIFVGNHQTWVSMVLWLGRLSTQALTFLVANLTSSCSAACSPNTPPLRPRSR
jgi:lysophosphatidate acyltransferase